MFNAFLETEDRRGINPNRISMNEGAQDQKSRILFIGIGNEYRSDDGVGLVIIRVQIGRAHV